MLHLGYLVLEFNSARHTIYNSSGNGKINWIPARTNQTGVVNRNIHRMDCLELYWAEINWIPALTSQTGVGNGNIHRMDCFGAIVARKINWILALTSQTGVANGSGNGKIHGTR